MKNYYKVLGLPTNATYEEVKNARNTLLKKYHPDCYQGSIDFAEEKTAEINDAFENIVNYLSKQPKTKLEKNTENFTNDNKTEKKHKREKIEQESIVFAYLKENFAKFKSWIKERKEKVCERQAKREQEKNITKETSKTNNDEMLTKKKKYIKHTLIEDERVSDQKGKRILDFSIYGLVLLLVVLIILYFSGAIKWVMLKKKSNL